MEKKRRRRGRREESQERYGSLVFCMETMILVWIIVWKYEFLWISLDFVWKKRKSNHKPNFDEFGSKRTLLGILVVFWTWVG